MENIIGWLLLAIGIVAPVLLVYSTIKLYRRWRLKSAQEEVARHERYAQYLRTREKERQAKEQDWKNRVAGATHVGKTTYDYISDQNRTTVTEKATGRKMSYVHENDSGPDLLTTALIANMLFNNKDSSSGTVSWKDDVPTVTTTDDEPRKSSSWSSSPSFSDDGPSYSSSSDSSPSSDW